MKDGGSPPPAPDPTATAQAQSGSNIQTAIANARLNRVNQTTPWGSISYTPGAVDANGVPTYSSEIKLDPQQQAQLDEQRKQQAYKQQLAAMLLGQAGGSLSKPLDLSGAHPVYDRYALSAPPAPQAQPQAPQGQGASRDAMMAQLMQYLRSAGQMPGNPLARAGSNMPMANALRDSGSVGAGAAGSPAPSTPTTPVTPRGPVDSGDGWDGVIPTGASSFGSMGYKPIYNTSVEYNGPADQRPLEGYDMGGPIQMDGKSYERVGHLPHNTTYFKNLDKSNFKYDPKLGLLTTSDNVTGGSPESFYDKYAPYLMMAMAGGGIAAEGAGLMGGGTEGLAATGGGSAGAGAGLSGGGAFDLGTGVATAAGAPVADLSTAASGGAPVTDLSTAVTRPGMGSQMLTNLQQGRGLLGLSGGQRAAVGAIPLLAQILRGGQRQGGR